MPPEGVSRLFAIADANPQIKDDILSGHVQKAVHFSEAQHGLERGSVDGTDVVRLMEIRSSDWDTFKQVAEQVGLSLKR